MPQQDDSPPAELTRRAILTGVVIGAALTPCNVYSGLKIGWSFNMSIAAGLLGAGLWQVASRIGVARRPFGMLENNINQTAASSAASIISGGLVAPIPALTLLTGQVLGWPALAFWVFAVSALGIVVAASLRRQMIIREGLRFPAGVATAETIRRIHGRGAEAAKRLRLLLGGALVAGAAKLVLELSGIAARLAPPFTLRAGTAGAASFHNLGLAFDPSLLMIGFGAIIGLRAGVSMLLGAVLAWGVLAPWLLARGWVRPGEADAVWFEPLIAWLLWPGATLLVVAALVSLAVSLTRLRRQKVREDDADGDTGDPSGLALLVCLVVTGGLAAGASVALFDLNVFEAILAVALSFVLAAVAARVTGETGITPVGAMGKITQLTFGAFSPGQVVSNLMAANITGGAAGQCADLMHDLKCGHLIGATARHQLLAQAFGVAAGSLVGSAVYLALIPDPKAMLITAEWPAPAVATWKAVAEVLSQGLHAIPQGAVPAMAIAAALGVVLGLAERMLPDRWARLVPSAPAMGLAFVIPAWNGISLFIGAALAALFARTAPEAAERATIPVAAGLVAGESLVGVALALTAMLG